MDNQLEQMATFFNNRARTYEDHMKNEVEGAKQAYIEIAKYIPKKEALRVIDLGCGTGLELEEMYTKNADMKVTGIDLSSEMLALLKEKFNNKDITIYQMSYFDYNYKKETFDTAVSCMTMHHFTHREKIELYAKIYHCLATDGRYVECDYMAPSQELEDFYYSESLRLRKEQGITEGFYHYDTPCSVENQINMLKEAGFTKVEKVWQMENTVLLICDK